MTLMRLEFGPPEVDNLYSTGKIHQKGDLVNDIRKDHQDAPIDPSGCFWYVGAHMLTEFVSLQLSREELKEIHAALLQKAMVEDETRHERGQEKIEHRGLLDHIEMLLGENEETLHMLDHATEDELWEFAWYSFTDEWSWFRAAQEVEKELGAEKAQTDATEFQKLVELNYQKHFESYVAEIDMHETSKKVKVAKSQPKTS